MTKSFVCLALVVLVATAFADTRAGGLSRFRPRMGADFLDPFGVDFWAPFSKAIDRHWNTGLQAHHITTPEITETETSFYITVDTAGYTKEELDVHVLGDLITISGHHKCEKPGLCIMRQFNKSYNIKADVDLDAITSRRTADGVLQLALPKKGRRSVHVAVAEEPEPTPAPLPEKKMEEVTVEVEK